MKLKNVLKKTLLMMSIGALTVGMTGCGSSEQNQVENTLDKEVIIVGLDDTFAPMGFKDQAGEIVGYDIDLAKAVGEKLGKTFEFQCINWDMKETELNQGNIDMIWNGYSVNEKRKELVSFSDPYLENRQVILTLADSPIETKADLAGKIVGAQNASSAVEAMEKDATVYESFDGSEAVTYETNNDVLMDLEAGRIDAAVADEVIIRYYINNNGKEKYKVLEEDFGDEQYAIGMRKSDEALVNAINEAYAELKADGTVKDISEKWFGEDISK